MKSAYLKTTLYYIEVYVPILMEKGQNRALLCLIKEEMYIRDSC